MIYRKFTAFLRLVHPGPRGYLLPGVPGFCQNVPATAGAAAVTALIFTTTQVVAKIAAVAAAAAAPAVAAAAAPAVPGTFWQNPGTPGNRYPFCPG